MKSDATPKSKGRGKERVHEGLAVSPGVAIGTAFVRESGDLQVPEYLIPTGRLDDETQRFQEAVGRALKQVGKLKAKALNYHGAAAEELGYLLDAHLQMLNSSRLIGGIEKIIVEDRRNAEAAVMAEVSNIAQEFAAMEDPYLRTRAQEVREVGHRIIRNLTRTDFASFDSLPKDSIILAEEITPADTALMDPARVAGFASVLGGAEGHTAIMARSLGLPAVVGVLVVPDLGPAQPEQRAGEMIVGDLIGNLWFAKRAAEGGDTAWTELEHLEANGEPLRLHNW